MICFVFHSIHFFEVEIYIYFVFEVLCKFSCLKLFHEVSHCFSCILTFQVVGQFCSFTVFLCVVVFFMLDSCFNLCSLCVCHGTLVRLNCLSSIQIDVFWLVYLVSICLRVAWNVFRVV